MAPLVQWFGLLFLKSTEKLNKLKECLWYKDFFREDFQQPLVHNSDNSVHGVGRDGQIVSVFIGVYYKRILYIHP